jgi:hypothetical protein
MQALNFCINCLHEFFNEKAKKHKSYLNTAKQKEKINMERYNYKEQVKNDLIDFINDNYNLNDFTNINEMYQAIYDDAFISDSVTGNASGSYFCNAWNAEEAICHNLDLLGEAFATFCEDDADVLKNGAESCDVTIRCYLLAQTLTEVLNEMMKEKEDEEC